MASRREALQLGVALAAASLTAACTETGNQAIPPTDKQGNFRLTHSIGLGGVAIGDGMNSHPDGDCRETLEEAWNAGIRYYDTSPWYGYGLSERRFGNFLYNVPREQFILSTKVGRVFTGDPHFIATDEIWKGKANFRYKFDYSGPGARRSVEDSLNRLGLSYIDIVYVHDIELVNTEINFEDSFKECSQGAFRELSKMRDEGIIKAWGIGVNTVEPVIRVIKEADPDICLCAEQYSLIEHEHALHNLFPLARERGVQLAMAGALNGGYLAGTPRYQYLTSNVTLARSQKRAALQEIAHRHRVDLRTAAIQFALAPSAVTSVPLGMHTATQVRENIAAFHATVPEDFWSELKHTGLIEPDAPTVPHGRGL